MSRTSNDPTKISAAHRDAERLTEFLKTTKKELRNENTPNDRYIDAVCAMKESDALAMLVLLLLCPHLLTQLPRLD